MMMDQKTKDALEASIRHWQENVDAKNPSKILVGSHSCELCVKFNDVNKANKPTFVRATCNGCPVKIATGQPHCHGTPYSFAVKAKIAWAENPTSSDKRKEWREAAQAMLDFLIFLLPSYEVAEAVHEVD